MRIFDKRGVYYITQFLSSRNRVYYGFLGDLVDFQMYNVYITYEINIFKNKYQIFRIKGIPFHNYKNFDFFEKGGHFNL